MFYESLNIIVNVFQLSFGRKEFAFFPQTFVLPFDQKLLKNAWDNGGSKYKWIIKPVCL